MRSMDKIQISIFKIASKKREIFWRSIWKVRQIIDATISEIENSINKMIILRNASEMEEEKIRKILRKMIQYCIINKRKT